MDVGCPLSINHSAINTWLRWQRPEGGNRWTRREQDSWAKRLKVVTITEQPRLAPDVAEWLLDESVTPSAHRMTSSWPNLLRRRLRKRHSSCSTTMCR